MNDSATKPEYTPEDLLTMPDGDSYELVDGRLVERHMGINASVVMREITRRLGNYCHEHRVGWVVAGGDAGYQGFPGSPRTVRKPDVSFVRFGRFPGEELPRGYASLAPDLAVEVISPNDLYEEVDQKIEEYLRAGVRLVWVISPLNHTVRVYRLDGSSASLRDADELDGEDVLPGFRCPVRELFPPPPAAATGDNGGPAPTPA
jgi:Uma2 family endonuclease